MWYLKSGWEQLALKDNLLEIWNRSMLTIPWPWNIKKINQKYCETEADKKQCTYSQVYHQWYGTKFHCFKFLGIHITDNLSRSWWRLSSACTPWRHQWIHSIKVFGIHNIFLMISAKAQQYLYFLKHIKKKKNSWLLLNFHQWKFWLINLQLQCYTNTKTAL